MSCYFLALCGFLLIVFVRSFLGSSRRSSPKTAVCSPSRPSPRPRAVSYLLSLPCPLLFASYYTYTTTPACGPPSPEHSAFLFFLYFFFSLSDSFSLCLCAFDPRERGEESSTYLLDGTWSAGREEWACVVMFCCVDCWLCARCMEME